MTKESGSLPEKRRCAGFWVLAVASPGPQVYASRGPRNLSRLRSKISNKSKNRDEKRANDFQRRY
jgi:hypothetical protein